MINKPAVSGKPPITLTGSGYAANTGAEVINLHYLNLTSGAGRINVRDGGPAGEIRIVLSSDAANGNDDYSPVQPAKFTKSVYIQFATGTGVVSVLMN